MMTNMCPTILRHALGIGKPHVQGGYWTFPIGDYSIPITRRMGGALNAHAFFLEGAFDWRVVRDDDQQQCLVALPKGAVKYNPVESYQEPALFVQTLLDVLTDEQFDRKLEDGTTIRQRWALLRTGQQLKEPVDPDDDIECNSDESDDESDDATDEGDN